MRNRIIIFLRRHPRVLGSLWKTIRFNLRVISLIIRPKEKTMLFASFGGRSFDDSPKAIYDEVCNRKEFDDWDLTWVFDDVNKYTLPRGKAIKIDSPSFFKALLTSKVWISNSGMDRNIGFTPRQTVKIETWHGTPIKKLAMDQHSGMLGRQRRTEKKDNKTIRCAQSEYDLEIFARIFNAEKESFLMCDLPRNDRLCIYNKDDMLRIKKELGIAPEKKVILYMPTYREYKIDNERGLYYQFPIDFDKWRRIIGDKYVMLVRAHYAINTLLGLKEDDFTINVSDYSNLNDLYIASDLLISDYSSAFFDYSILGKPMLCYAFDFDEYKTKRGMYMKIEEELPCRIDTTEDGIIRSIVDMDYDYMSRKANAFHKKYTPNAGHASRLITDELIKRLES